MGVMSFGPIGLLFGEIIGRTSGAGVLWARFWRKQSRQFLAVSLTGMWTTGKRYWRFPVISAGAALLNEAGTAVPALLLGSFYGMETLGWFAFAQKFIGWPSMLLSQAVGQVCDPSAAQTLFSSTLKRVFFVAVGPMVALAVVAPTLFVFVFGPSWGEAGQFARFLSLAYLARSAVVPVAMTLNIVERQDLQLYWDVSRLILVLIGMSAAYAGGWTADSAVIVYAAVNTAAYIAIGFLSAKALRHRTSHLRTE
jgi:O-antigen/teichoic acid export membrane protein